MMEPKYKPWEEVCVITQKRTKRWIDSVTIYMNRVTYSLWDWCNDYYQFDEWQIEAYSPVTE